MDFYLGINYLAYDHNDKICRNQFSEIASNTPHSIPQKSLFTWNFWEVNAFIQESCEILTIENQHSWMSGPDDVIIVDHLFTSKCWSYHCHQHHFITIIIITIAMILILTSSNMLILSSTMKRVLAAINSLIPSKSSSNSARDLILMSLKWSSMEKCYEESWFRILRYFPGQLFIEHYIQ